MTPELTPALPRGSVVLFNHLGHDGFKGEDLFAATLPCGLWLDVGWYNNSRDSGKYVARLFDSQGEDVGTPLVAADVNEAVRLAESLARNSCANGGFMAGCGTDGSANECRKS